MSLKEKLLKNTIKGLIPTISENLGSVSEYLEKYLSGIELTKNESRASILCCLSKTDCKPYIMVCALDDSDMVVRVLSKQKVDEFITLILKQL